MDKFPNVSHTINSAESITYILEKKTTKMDNHVSSGRNFLENPHYELHVFNRGDNVTAVYYVYRRGGVLSGAMTSSPSLNGTHGVHADDKGR